MILIACYITAVKPLNALSFPSYAATHFPRVLHWFIGEFLAAVGGCDSMTRFQQQSTYLYSATEGIASYNNKVIKIKYMHTICLSAMKFVPRACFKPFENYTHPCAQCCSHTSKLTAVKVDLQ